MDNINEPRKQKLERLRARGINPYPNNYPHSHTTRQAVKQLEEQEARKEVSNAPVSLAGRITAMRKMGKASFFDIRDGEGKMQLLMHNGNFNEADQELFKDLDIGDIIGVKGALQRTRTGEPTLTVANFTLLTKSLQPLPEKWHGLADTEIRYRQRYIDLIASVDVKNVFEKRSRIITAVRSFLDKQGFLEVETPVLQALAGGALAAPFLPIIMPSTGIFSSAFAWSFISSASSSAAMIKSMRSGVISATRVSMPPITPNLQCWRPMKPTPTIPA
jgi:lysyl-tRNA synthetase class 2